MKTLIAAAYVATMAGPMIRDGAIVCANGTILDVGPERDLRKAHPDAQHVHHGNVILLPGLVNAHTHLELTGLGQLPRPRNFVDWVLDLRARLSQIPDLTHFIQEGVRAGIAQGLRHGVTTVGDITLNPTITRPILRDSAINAVSFGEVLGMAGRRGQLQARLAAATDRTREGGQLVVGIEPHAPYSLDLPGFRQCVEAANALAMPLATHLAETPDEAQFLADGSGEFARLWAALGDSTTNVPRFAGGPIRAVASVGFLDRPALLAHVNYADDDELAILAKSGASVVYCPRTHAYFGHPPHRFADMLDRGINVALGTDSAASAPDLNLLDDARLVHRLRPDIPAQTLLEMMTVRGAKALGLEHSVGQLKPGMRANYCAFAIKGGDPFLELLESDACAQAAAP